MAEIIIKDINVDMLSMDQTIAKYREILALAEKEGSSYEVVRHLSRSDLFFLLLFMCGRKDIAHEWLFERCNEVQENPDNRIDIWAREHYKSTIITFGKTIQDVINDPNICIGIFSFKFNAAADFLKQIKNEVKRDIWIQYFPDIFYEKPDTQAPSWSERAMTVKRKVNRKEATIESNGFVDSLPVGRHYDLMIYDDIVTERSVSTEEQIRKTQEAFELSLSLGSAGGRKRIVGTFYNFDDCYSTILDRKLAIPRIYPMVDENNEPVFFSKEYAVQKRMENTAYIFSCQYLLNPRAESYKAFDREWLRFWPANRFDKLNRYIIVDPANSKTKRGDYTAMLVIGLGPDDNYYIIDIVRDKLSLTERSTILMELHRNYKPLKVFYESYGLQADIDHIKYVQEREMYRFSIVKLGGKTKKEDRIAQLEPLFRNERIYLPDKCIRSSINGEMNDLTQEFIAEYVKFPFGAHDDMMDCLSRICDDDVHMKKPARIQTTKVNRGKINYNWRNL